MSEFGEYMPPEAFKKQGEDKDNALFERPETTLSRRHGGNYTPYGAHALEQFPNNKETAPSGDMSKPPQGNMGDTSRQAGDSTNAQGQDDSTASNPQTDTHTAGEQRRSTFDFEAQKESDAKELAIVRLKLEMERLKEQGKQHNVHNDFRPG